MRKKIFHMESLGRDLLVQADLDLALEEKPERMTDYQWMFLEKKACFVMKGYLVDMTLYSVLEERTQKICGRSCTQCI